MFVIFARYQIVTKLLLTLVLLPLMRLMNRALLAASGMNMLTSSDFAHYFVSPAGISMLVLSLLVAGLISGVDLFAFVHLSVAYRERDEKLSIGKAWLLGVKDTRRYVSPSGLLVLLFIVILMPILGFGFSSAATSWLHIPNFISSVIDATPLYLLIYLTVFVVSLWLSLRHIFVLHEVVDAQVSMREALRRSRRLTRHHVGALLWRSLLQELRYILVWLAFFIPTMALYIGGLFLTARVGWMGVEASELSVMLFAAEFYSLASLIFTPWLVDIVTRLRIRFVSEAQQAGNLSISQDYQPFKSPARHKVFSFARIAAMLLTTLAAFTLNSVFSAVVVSSPQSFITMRNTKVYAHRAGGDLGPENTIEGMLAAQKAHAYGSEIDVQRTKDGAYVLNHDDTFARVAGVNRRVSDMTLSEIKKLRVENLLLDSQDNPNAVKYASVPTAREFLSAARGKMHVLLELKGPTANRKMADDMVSLVRELHMQKEVTLIGLDYQLISYVNTQYPDIDTGFLYYYSFGDIEDAKAKTLIMEEGMANEDQLDVIHSAHRQAFVWTVNTNDSMDRFSFSSADAMITDYPVQALNSVWEAHHASTFEKLVGSLFVTLFY